MRETIRQAVRVASFAIALCATALPALPGPVAGSAGSTGGDVSSIRIEPSRTRVSLARVHLTLGELRPDGDDLVGDFEISVPLLPLSDDRGTVRIHMDGPLPELTRRGAVLDGTARSESGQVNPVRCTVFPDGSLQISITTPRRTLSFETRYRLLAGGV